MSDQGSVASGQQPVRCGCGGKAEHTYTSRYDSESCRETHFISCNRCYIMVDGKSYEEAVQRWNTAMSGNKVRVPSCDPKRNGVIMYTLNEVIEGMEHCRKNQCKGCPGAKDLEGFECAEQITHAEPLRYLKEYRDLLRNDMAEVTGAGTRLCCGSCGKAIFYGAEVCPHCGRKLNWAALEIGCKK